MHFNPVTFSFYGFAILFKIFSAHFDYSRLKCGLFFAGSHPVTDSDFDEFSDGDNKANSEDSGSTKNSGPSHHVVTVTTGGGTGVNGFLSGSPPGGGLKKIFFPIPIINF